MTIPSVKGQMTADNYETNYLRFEDRQAGVSLVYSHDEDKYYYNVYCIEMTLLKEIFSVEFEFLEDALRTVNEEFGTWELVTYEKKSGCSTCVAKK